MSSIKCTTKGVGAALFLSFCAAPAMAGSVHERFFHQGPVLGHQVAEWSRLAGTRGYSFNLDVPQPSDLEALAKLRGADELTVSASVYPRRDEVPLWRALAARTESQGLVFVGLGMPLPYEDEIDVLNAIGFRKVLLYVAGYPDPESAARLERLKGDIAIHFVVSYYPRSQDMAGISAVPARMQLGFVTDYWPWEPHMDLFNLLPHTVRLRVSGEFPPEGELEYLKGIQRLSDITILTEFDASDSGLFAKLDALPVHWISKERVPSDAALKVFRMGTGSRRLTIDQDWPLTAEDRARLGRSGLAVEWVHQAP